MTDTLFFPPSGGKAFMPQVARGSRPSEPVRDSQTNDDRLLLELRDMRRQIQSSCAEEIKFHSQRLLTEIKREMRSAMGKDDPPMRGTEGSLAGSVSFRPPPFVQDCGALDKSGTAAAVGEHPSPLAPTAPVLSDPRCPLSAHGDAPPLLPLEVDPPPAQPITEEGEEEEEGDAELPRRRALKEEEYQAVDWEPLTRMSVCTATDRRLSLTVDLCRRSKRTMAKAIHEMSVMDFLKSTRYDNMIGGLIILNALTIGIQIDYTASNFTDDLPLFYLISERCFLVCFIIELILRMYVQGFRFFYDRKTLFWNFFDSVIVLAQIIEEAVTLAFPSMNDSNVDQFRTLRFLRILRVIRILRVVRVLHLISELRTIVSSIMGSFKSLGWTVVLLLLMIYTVSVFFTQTISEHLISKRNGGTAFNEQDTVLLYYFGTLSRTVLSLWQAMSGGADWDSMAGPLISQVGVFTGVLFAGYIAFALLALMNAVTGVFVQAALQSAKDDEDAFLVDQVVKLFEQASDDDQQATISLDQIWDRFKDPSVAKVWRSISVEPTEAEYLFSLLDINDSGEVPFQEFLSGCLRLHGPAKSMDVLTVMQEARSAMRLWRLAQKRQDEYQFMYQGTIETIANSVSTCSNLLARLAVSIDSAVEVASQNQDKIGRLERRMRSFESSLSSVRIAASNMNKMTDIFETVICPDIGPGPCNKDAPGLLEGSNGASTPAGFSLNNFTHAEEV